MRTHRTVSERVRWLGPSFSFAPLAVALGLAALALLGLLARPVVAAVSSIPAAQPAAQDAAAPPPVVVPITGEVVAFADGLLGVREDGGERPVAFTVTGQTAVTRGGTAAAPADLRPGDRVAMAVDPRTGTVLSLDVRPVAAGGPSNGAALLAALGLVAAAGVLVARRRAAARPQVRRPLPARPAPRPLTPTRRPAARRLIIDARDAPGQRPAA